MKKIILIMILSVLSLNGYSQDSTETIKTKSASFAVQNTTTTIKKTKLKIPKHISKEEQERMDKEAEEDRKEKLIPPLERMMRDSKKPCPPYYESKHMKMTLVKEFRDEKEFESYTKEHEIIEKRKRVEPLDEGIQLLDEKGNIIKKLVRTERPITKEEKKYALQKYAERIKNKPKDWCMEPIERVEKEINTHYTYYTPFYGSYAESDRNKNYFLQREEYGTPAVEEGHWTSIYKRIKVFDINEHLLAEIENEQVIKLSPDSRYMVATDPDPWTRTGHVAFYDMKGKLLNALPPGVGHSQIMIFSENGDYVGAKIGYDHALLFNRNGKLLWKKKVGFPGGRFIWISDDGHVLMSNAECINSKGDIIWRSGSLGLLNSSKIYIDKKKERLILLGSAHNTDEIVLVDFKTGEILDEINLDRGAPTGFIGHQVKIRGFDTKIYLYDIQW